MGNTDYAIIYGKNLDQEVYGIYTESIGVRNLKWEKTKQWDLGLDLGLFNDEITLTVDYYNKHTKGLIERMPVPSVAGISIEPYGNVGDVVNRGWEFSAALHKQINKVKFGLYGNLSTVHNEVLILDHVTTLPTTSRSTACSHCALLSVIPGIRIMCSRQMVFSRLKRK